MIKSIKLVRKAAFSVALFYSLLLSFHAVAKELQIWTASLSWVFYPMGQGIANIVNKYVGGEIIMVPAGIAGAVENLRLIGSGEVDIAATNNNPVALLIKGAGSNKSGKVEMQTLAVCSRLQIL